MKVALTVIMDEVKPNPKPNVERVRATEKPPLLQAQMINSPFITHRGGSSSVLFRAPATGGESPYAKIAQCELENGKPVDCKVKVDTDDIKDELRAGPVSSL